MWRFLSAAGARPAVASEPVDEGLSGIFMRHARRKPSAEERDPRLIEAGYLQAISTGQQFAKEKNFFRDRPIIFSPYRRTIQSGVLMLAQQDFDPTNPPEVLLDPRFSEWYEGAKSKGLELDEWQAWLQNPEWIEDALDHAVKNNLISEAEKDLVKARALAILGNLNKDRMENKEWWPAAEDDNGAESIEDVRARVYDGLQEHCESADKTPFIVSHSFVIGHLEPEDRGTVPEAEARWIIGITPGYERGEVKRIWGPDPKLDLG